MNKPEVSILQEPEISKLDLQFKICYNVGMSINNESNLHVSRYVQPVTQKLLATSISIETNEISQAKTNEISQAVLVHVDLSQSKTSIVDHHWKLEKPIAQGTENRITDYHMQVTNIFKKTCQHDQKVALSMPAVNRNIAQALLDSSISKLNQKLEHRDKSLHTLSVHLNHSFQISKHVKTSSHQEALAFIAPISKQVNALKNEISKVNSTLETTLNETAKNLVNTVKLSGLSKKEALSKYKNLLDSVYTEQSAINEKTKRTLQTLTIIVGEKNPNLTEEEGLC